MKSNSNWLFSALVALPVMLVAHAVLGSLSLNRNAPARLTMPLLARLTETTTERARTFFDKFLASSLSSVRSL